MVASRYWRAAVHLTSVNARLSEVASSAQSKRRKPMTVRDIERETNLIGPKSWYSGC